MNTLCATLIMTGDGLPAKVCQHPVIPGTRFCKQHTTITTIG